MCLRVPTDIEDNARMWKLLGSYVLKGAIWLMKNHPDEIIKIAVKGTKK